MVVLKRGFVDELLSLLETARFQQKLRMGRQPRDPCSTSRLEESITRLDLTIQLQELYEGMWMLGERNSGLIVQIRPAMTTFELQRRISDLSVRSGVAAES